MILVFTLTLSLVANLIVRLAVLPLLQKNKQQYLEIIAEVLALSKKKQSIAGYEKS